MSEAVADPTVGVNAMLPARLTVTVNGRVLTMRRLGVRDAFALLRILSRVLQGVNVRELDAQALGVILLQALIAQDSEDELTTLVSGVFGLSPQEFTDPDTVPLEALPELIEALGGHPDLSALAKNLQRLAVTIKPPAA